jgi:peptidoglycan/LPS O-acetylase OafA/YrhL
VWAATTNHRFLYLNLTLHTFKYDNMNLKPTNIPNLTPLRGIAALMVAVYHFDSVIANFVNQHRSMLIEKCYLMVDLFFIMSGFIMLHVYGSKFTNSIPKQDFLDFIRARFARVYPLHFFSLLLAVVIFYASHQPDSPVNNPSAIPTHLLLLHSFGIHEIFTWNVPSWSISAEWWAYMIFPLLVLFLGKYKRMGIILLSALSIILYFSILYLLPRVNPFVPNLLVPHDLNVTYDYGYLRGLAGFIAGMITYIGFQKNEIVKYFNNDFAGILLIFTTILLFHFGANDLIIVVSFILLVLAIAANQKGIHKLFQSRPLQYLGDISYSIYLIHSIAMFFLAVPILTKLGYIFKGPGSLQIPFFTGTWVCIVYLLSIIFISSVSYHLIERPCRNWINRKSLS